MFGVEENANMNKGQGLGWDERGAEDSQFKEIPLRGMKKPALKNTVPALEKLESNIDKEIIN